MTVVLTGLNYKFQIQQNSSLPSHQDVAAFIICQGQQYIRWLKRAGVCVRDRVRACACTGVYFVLFPHLILDQCALSSEHIRLFFYAELQPSEQDSEGRKKTLKTSSHPAVYK